MTLFVASSYKYACSSFKLIVTVTIVPGKNFSILLNLSLLFLFNSYASLPEININSPLFFFKKYNNVLNHKPPGACSVLVECPGKIAHCKLLSGFFILFSVIYSSTFSRIVLPISTMENVKLPLCGKNCPHT